MIGTTVARYRIVRKVGEGGMGSVWEAVDPVLDRRVALKLLSSRSLDSESARTRFVREARAAGALHHPGIAAVFDAGDDDGTLYIAFQYVDGRTVADLVRNGPVPVGASLRIAAEAARGLACAHENGILHRDVSGRNVMVERDGHAVIVDFGLALPEDETRLTRPGSTMGTLPYLAPEVLRGEPASPASDLYGLGVVLYQLLTGTLPFDGDRMETVLYAVLNHEVERPSGRNPVIPREVDTVVARLLDKDPSRRPGTAAGAADALEALLRDLPPALRDSGTIDLTLPETISIPPPGDPEPEQDSPSGSSARVGRVAAGGPRAGRRARRLLIRAATVLVVAAVGFWLWRISRTGSDGGRFESVAVLPLEVSGDDAREMAYLSAGFGEALVTRLGRISGLRVIPWTTSRRYGGDGLALEDIAGELEVNSLLVGSVRGTGPRIQVALSLVDAETGLQVWANEFEDGSGDLFTLERRAALEAALRLVGRLKSGEERRLLDNPATSVEAYDAYLRGAAALEGGTRESNLTALRYFDRALGLDEGLTDAWVGLGAAHLESYFLGWGGGSDVEAAEAAFRTALDRDPGSMKAVRGLVRVAWHRGRPEDCLRLVARAQGPPRSPLPHMVRGEALLFGGMPSEAVPELRRALHLDTMNRGAQWLIPVAHAFAGEFESAIESGEEYLRRFGEDPEVLLWIGFGHHGRGELDRARPYYRRSIELFGESTNHYAGPMEACLAFDLGDSTGAETVLRESVGRLEERLARSPGSRNLRTLLAACLALLGDWIAVEKERVALARSADNPILGDDDHALLAAAYARQGRHREAASMLHELVRAGSFVETGLTMFRVLGGSDALDRPEYAAFLRDWETERRSLRERYLP